MLYCSVQLVYHVYYIYYVHEFIDKVQTLIKLLSVNTYSAMQVSTKLEIYKKKILCKYTYKLLLYCSMQPIYLSHYVYYVHRQGKVVHPNNSLTPLTSFLFSFIFQSPSASISIGLTISFFSVQLVLGVKKGLHFTQNNL